MGGIPRAKAYSNPEKCPLCGMVVGRNGPHYNGRTCKARQLANKLNAEGWTPVRFVPRDSRVRNTATVRGNVTALEIFGHEYKVAATKETGDNEVWTTAEGHQLLDTLSDIRNLVKLSMPEAAKRAHANPEALKAFDAARRFTRHADVLQGALAPLRKKLKCRNPYHEQITH